MKRWLKNTLIVSLCLIPCGLVVGFSNSWSNKIPISCVGSSGVKPFVEALAKDYMDTNKNVDITVEAGGSGFGIEQVAKGFANIGDASKDPYSAVRGEDDGKGGFRSEWENNKIKTVTFGWEAICLLYIPPKGLSQPATEHIDELLSVDENNIGNLFRIFSGINDGIIWSDGIPNISANSLAHLISPNASAWLNTNDEQLLKQTSIIPYVRSGGSLTSGTAASFINGTNLDVNSSQAGIQTPYSLLTNDQKKAFDYGDYGSAFHIQQTDEANSRAWDMFNKSNNPGQVVYLSSGFIEQNKSLINKNGYGIISYKAEPYDIEKVDTQNGYNWFRPLNILVSTKNQTSTEIEFIKSIFSYDASELKRLGAKPLENEELIEMFDAQSPGQPDFNSWYPDIEWWYSKGQYTDNPWDQTKWVDHEPHFSPWPKFPIA